MDPAQRPQGFNLLHPFPEREVPENQIMGPSGQKRRRQICLAAHTHRIALERYLNILKENGERVKRQETSERREGASEKLNEYYINYLEKKRS